MRVHARTPGISGKTMPSAGIAYHALPDPVREMNAPVSETAAGTEGGSTSSKSLGKEALSSDEESGGRWRSGRSVPSRSA